MQIKVLDANGNVAKTAVINMERQKFLDMLKRIRPGPNVVDIQIGKGVYRLSYDRRDIGAEQRGGFLPALLALLPTLGTALATGSATAIGSAATGGIIGAIKRAIQRGKEKRALKRAEAEAKANAEQSGGRLELINHIDMVMMKGKVPMAKRLWQIIKTVEKSKIPNELKQDIVAMTKEYLKNLSMGDIPAMIYEKEMSGSGIAETAGDVLKSVATDMFSSSSSGTSGSSFFTTIIKEIAKSTASGLLKDAVISLTKKFLGKKKKVSASDVLDASRRIEGMSEREILDFLKAKQQKEKQKDTYDYADDEEDPPEYEEEPTPKPKPKPKPKPQTKPEDTTPKPIPKYDNYNVQLGMGAKRPLTSYQRFTSKIFEMNKGNMNAQKIMRMSSELWKELKMKGRIVHQGVEMRLDQF